MCPARNPVAHDSNSTPSHQAQWFCLTGSALPRAPAGPERCNSRFIQHAFPRLMKADLLYLGLLPGGRPEFCRAHPASSAVPLALAPPVQAWNLRHLNWSTARTVAAP